MRQLAPVIGSGSRKTTPRSATVRSPPAATSHQHILGVERRIVNVRNVGAGSEKNGRVCAECSGRSRLPNVVGQCREGATVEGVSVPAHVKCACCCGEGRKIEAGKRSGWRNAPRRPDCSGGNVGNVPRWNCRGRVATDEKKGIGGCMPAGVNQSLAFRLCTCRIRQSAVKNWFAHQLPPVNMNGSDDEVGAAADEVSEAAVYH